MSVLSADWLPGEHVHCPGVPPGDGAGHLGLARQAGGGAPVGGGAAQPPQLRVRGHPVEGLGPLPD